MIVLLVETRGFRKLQVLDLHTRNVHIPGICPESAHFAQPAQGLPRYRETGGAKRNRDLQVPETDLGRRKLHEADK